MSRVRVVSNQTLVDIVSRPVPKELEREIFAQRGEVCDGIARKPPEGCYDQHSRNHLNSNRAIARIVNELT